MYIDLLIKKIIHIKIKTDIRSAYKDIVNYFPNVTKKINSNTKYDYFIYYRIKTFESDKYKYLAQKGKDIIPFRNEKYKQINYKDCVIAYCSGNNYNEITENVVIKKNNQISLFIYNSKNHKTIIRLIRELIMQKLIVKGFFPIHSASYIDKRKAIVYFGEKGSGKSRELLKKIYEGKNVIANDINFIGKINNKIYVVGIPYDFTFFKPEWLKTKEQEKNKNKTIEFEKIRFSPKNIEKEFNVKVFFKAELKEIIYLDIENNDEEKSEISFIKMNYYLTKYSREKNFNFPAFLNFNKNKIKYNYKILKKGIKKKYIGEKDRGII